MDAINAEAARDFTQALKQAQAEASFIAVSEQLRTTNALLSSIERATSPVVQPMMKRQQSLTQQHASGQHRKGKKTSGESGRKHKQKKAAFLGPLQPLQAYDSTYVQGIAGSIDGVGLVSPIPPTTVVTVHSGGAEPEKKREKRAPPPNTNAFTGIMYQQTTGQPMASSGCTYFVNQ